MTELRYISFVGRDLEPHGPSHIIKPVNSKRAKPFVYCGTTTQNLNWTQQIIPKTEVCKNCLKVLKANVLVKDNIESHANHFIFVSHVNTLATAGFATRDALYRIIKTLFALIQVH